MRKMIRGLVQKLAGVKEVEPVIEKPVVVIESSQDGVMFRHIISDGGLEWVRNGNKLTN